jgi:hypothetical protein
MLKHLFTLVCTLGLAIAAGSGIAFAATPAAEKAFVDAYRKAIETSDKKALLGFLHTDGANPMALDFYKAMVVESAGAKIEEIGLKDLTAEDKQKIATSPGPDGKPMKTNIPIVKKLTMKLEKKYSGGSSTSTSSVFIGDVNGKLVIAVPGK